MDEPLVSAVINNYNYARYLPDAIESALDQTYGRTEIVVVDDGSTDASREIIAEYGSRVHAVLKSNGGQASAFNAGVAAARGDIICFLDADDVWHRDKVARVVEALATHPQTVWLRHALAIVDQDRRQTGDRLATSATTEIIPPIPELYLEHAVSAATSAIAIRRTGIDGVFPLPEELGAAFRHDADALLLVLLGTLPLPGLSLPAVLGDYRRHGDQQYASAERFVAMLERQVVVARLTSRLWSERTGRVRMATSIFKHELILRWLRSGERSSRLRWRELARGLQATSGLCSANWRLAIRQSLALLYAFATPGHWVANRLPQAGSRSPLATGDHCAS